MDPIKHKESHWFCSLRFSLVGVGKLGREACVFPVGIIPVYKESVVVLCRLIWNVKFDFK